jgi:hypothetical protein
MNTEIVFFAFLVFGLALVVLGVYAYKTSLAKRQKELDRLVGLCYIANLRKGSDGNLEVACKTNQGKYWYPVPANHPSLLDLQSGLGSFVTISLNKQCPGGLQFEFAPSFADSLQVNLDSVAQALAEAASAWPLGGGTDIERLLASLCEEYAPLEQERVLASLVSWQRQYWNYPELALLLRGLK